MKTLFCLVGILFFSYSGAETEQTPSLGHSRTRLARALQFSYDNCNKHSLFTLGTVNVNQIGSEFHFSASFDSREEVTGGKIKVDVVKKGFSLLKKHFDFDLCEELPNGCPVAKGRNQVSARRHVPVLLKGSYKIYIKAESNKNQELFCVNAEARI